MGKTVFRKFFDKMEEQLKEEYKIELYDKEYGCGYGFFDCDKDSIIEFKVKGLSKWKFGCWFSKNNGIKATIFTQFEQHIDKFKPSRSALRCEEFVGYRDGRKYIDKYDLEGMSLFDLPEMINYMKKHPVKSYWIDVRQIEKSWEMDNVGSWFEMVKDIIQCNKMDNDRIRLYKYFQKWMRKLCRKGKIEAYYSRDRLNEPPLRCNDDYYILCKDTKLFNKIDRWVRKYQGYWKLQGTVYLRSDELNFWLDITQQYYQNEEDVPMKGTKEYHKAIEEMKDYFMTNPRRLGEVERMV